MPISDEIIELEPVKKSKSKLIIMFVIMGVLLALAITFLVLYLLKPNVEENTGRVNGVVGETSALFVDSSGDGEVKLASVGNDYTVYADVSVEGTADPGVNWTWEPIRAVTELSHGNLGEVEAVDEDGQSKPAARYYFTFRPSAEYADGNTPVTITARSMSDVNQRAEITFYIVNQATEKIEIQRISNDGGPYSNITYNENGQISLPYYSKDANNKIYTISFRQLGKFNPTTGLYSDLTRSSNGKDGQPTYKVDISCDKTDAVISSLRVVDGTDGNESFRFKLCGAGDAVITLTANNYNDFGEPYSVSVKILAESTETLGYIDDIRIYDKPVDDANGKFYKENVNKQYTMDNYGAIPRSSTVFTMPYNIPNYSNILQHIVLLPLSIQYNEDGTRKDDWANRINVTSSLSDLLAVTPGLNCINLQTKAYGASNKCMLTVTSTDRLGVTVSSSINVNVVAQNTQGALTVKKEGSSANEDVSKNISTAQGSSLDISVAYTLTAPSDVDREIFVTSGYLSKNYTVSMTSKATGQSVTDFSLAIGSKNIEWGKTQTLDTSMTVAKDGNEASTRYKGTVTFKLTIPNDRNKIPDGDYVFKYEKIGTPSLTDTNGRELFPFDTSWTLSATFSVTAKARTAMFKDESVGAAMAKLGGKSGNFVKTDDRKARMYLQNRNGDLPTGFDFKQLITVTDGVYTVGVTCVSSTGNLTVKGATGDQTFSFPGKTRWNQDASQGTVTITVKNNAEETIGTFEIEIFLIDPISAISIDGASGATEISYDRDGILSGGISFSTDRILNSYTFRQDVDITDNSEKYNAAAHNNFELLSHIDTDLSVYKPFAEDRDNDSNNIKFKYPDKNGTTVFEYMADDGKIYPRVDLYGFSYNNDIDVTSLIIRYYTVPDARFETAADIKSCSKEYKFTRKADDIALFTNRDYYNDRIVHDDGNKFTYPINMGALGAVYTSAVVNIDVDDDAYDFPVPVVVKYAETQPEHQNVVKILNIEDVYINWSSDVGFNVEGDDNGTAGRYYNIWFTAPQISGESMSYTTNIQGAGGGYTLDVAVLNRARPIASIELFSEYSQGTGGSVTSTELTELKFGEYGNARSDAYQKTVFIKATFQRFQGDADKLYKQFEPITLKFPDDKYVLTVGERTYSGKASYELTATQFIEGEDFYVWTCTIALADDATARAQGKFEVYDKFADGGNDAAHKSASATVSVGTGVNSIGFNVDGEKLSVGIEQNQSVDVDFVLKTASDAGQPKTIAIDIKPYSNTFGEKLIKYDIDKLVFTPDSVVGLKCDSGLALDTPGLTLKLEADKITTPYTCSYVITLKDTANGANTEFKLTLNVTVKADIYAVKPAQSGYTVTTSGANSGKSTVSGSVTFNGGNAKKQPDTTAKTSVDYKIVRGGTGEDYVNDGSVSLNNLDKNNGTFTIEVANGLCSGEYAIRIHYKSDYNEITEYVPIEILTSSNYVRWSGDGNADVRNDNITVSSETDTFDFAAEVYNRGTNAVVNSESSKVSYAVYDSAENRKNNSATKSSIASVNSQGVLSFTGPTSASGKLYLRASYADEKSGETFYADANIDYNIVVTSFNISGVDAKTFDASNKTFNLYYLNRNAYTTLDLSGKIAAVTPFNVTPDQTPTVTITPSNRSVLNVTGNKLIPGGTGTVTLTISVSGGVQPLTETYTVNITAISDLALVDNSGTINIVENGYVDVARKVVEYDGLTSTFSVTAPDKVIVGGVTDNKTARLTFDRARFGAVDYKVYGITATTVYELTGGSSLVMVGSFSVSAPYNLTVNGTYTLSFDLYADGDKIDEDSENTITDSSSYKLKVDVPSGSSWYTAADWHYSASDSNSIVGVGAFSGGEATLTFDTSKAGVISLKVTANVYGKKYESAVKTYTFTYGGNFTTKLQTSSVGSSTFADFANTGTLAVDFDTDTAKRVIRYVIDVSGIGGAVTDVKIDFVGAATAGELAHSGNIYYRDFTLDGASTLILSGSFVVGGKAYTTDKYTVTLTATEPDFELVEKTDKTELGAKNDMSAFDTATFEVNNSANAFKGGTTVTYSIADGDDRASIDPATGVLTVKPTANAASGSVIVRATITVNSGVFAGKTYTVDKVISIRGAALPTLTLQTPSVTANSGATLNIGGGTLFTVSGGYAYGCEYTVTDAPQLVAGTDYSINKDTGALEVKATDKTLAGGKIKVKIKATVTSNVNKGATAEGTLEVVIVPSAQKTAVNVAGAVGTYDIKSAVTPYSYDRAGFVQGTDEYTVEYTIVTSVVGITARGDKLVISEAVTSEKSVTLNAKLTFVGNSAYKGTVLTVNGVTVNIHGLDLGSTTVVWQTDKYASVKVKDILPQNVAANAGNITVTLVTNGGFASVAYNGTADATISVDKDFNIATSSDGAKAIEYSVIIATDGGYSYYGEGTLDVDPVEPTLSVTIGGVEYQSGTGRYTAYVGDSFNVNFAETHGFDIESVVIGDIGEGLSYVAGGTNQMFTAAGTRSASSVTFSVKVGGVTIPYSLEIAIEEKPTELPFTATNTQTTLMYVNSGNASGTVTSVLTPSSAYATTKTVQSSSQRVYYVYSPSGSLNSYISGIVLRGYDADGNSTQIGGSTNIGNTRYLYLYPTQSYISTDFVRYEIEFTFKLNTRNAFNLSTTFYWVNGGNVGQSSSQNVNYVVSRSSSAVDVTYNANGGNSNSTASYTYGQTVTAPTAPTKTGYNFAGWYTVANPDPAKDEKCLYVFGNSICASMTLYAGWTVKNDIAVTFNANGGALSGSNSINQTYNVVYALPENTPTRDGYTFVGWYTATSGGDAVTASTVCTNASDHTLYAHWRANTYTVTFNANGGALDALSTSKTVTFAARYGTLPAPRRSGYRFIAWHLGSVGGSVVTDTAVVATAENHTLYAEWSELNNIAVTFNANGGTLSDSGVINQTYNAKYSLPVSIPTRDGYTFVEWVDANGNRVDADTTVANVNAHTLYAKWTARTDIAVKLNDGTTEQTITRTYGGAYALPTPTRTGYTFKHWYVQGGNEATPFTATAVGSEALVEGGLTLVAKWEANKYYVFLNYVEEGRVEAKEVTFGGNYNLPTQTRTGYTFAWYTKSGDTETEFAETTVGEEALNGLILYGKWTANTVSVTFDVNGGSPLEQSDTTKYVTYGSTYGTLPTPTRDDNNYTFEGWFATVGGVETKFDSNKTVGEEALVEGGLTLVAKWTETVEP